MTNEGARDRAGPDGDHEERRRLLRRLVNFTLRDFRELWKLGAFAELAPGPRALFEALVSHMNVDTMEAFPSQRLLADEIGWSLRSVESYTTSLKDLGIINEPRVLRARGVLHYELGPASYAAVREYLAKFPAPSGVRATDLQALDEIEQLQARVAELEARENAVVAALGEAAADRIRCITQPLRVGPPSPSQTAVAASEVVNSFKTDQASFSSDRARANEEEESISISEEDRRAARFALDALNARRFPGRRIFTVVHELAMAARCAALATAHGLVGATCEEKRAALERAIEGACTKSTGIPNAKYVFGDDKKFRDNFARAPQKRTKPRELEPVEPEELADAQWAINLVAGALPGFRAASGG